MSKLLIGTNLKMYKGIAETKAYLEDLQSLTADLTDRVTLFVIPAFTTLDQANRSIQNNAILLGAQNMHPAEEGQFTGEISPGMLKEVGVEIIEIGHSERRHVFDESDEFLNEKVLSALKHGFTALLCIGETIEQKRVNISDEILHIQLAKGLFGLERELANKLWIAYEPVWAIGVHGTPAEPGYVQARHLAIKYKLAELLPDMKVPVFYGGSVNLQNAEAFLACPDVDGLFIGRTAWVADDFHRLIRQVLPAWERKSSNV